MAAQEEGRMTAEELSALRDVLMDSDDDVLQGERVDNMMLDVCACSLGAHVRASVRVYAHIFSVFVRWLALACVRVFMRVYGRVNVSVGECIPLACAKRC